MRRLVVGSGNLRGNESVGITVRRAKKSPTKLSLQAVHVEPHSSDNVSREVPQRPSITSPRRETVARS